MKLFLDKLFNLYYNCNDKVDPIYRFREATKAMNRLMMKWRSNRGASITFALLIFLVCAVISSVVIVAATTAGGRLSGVKESDQRYFAVTAAADALRNALEGTGTENAVLVTYKVDADGKAIAGSASTTDTTDGLCTKASLWVMGGSALTPISIKPEQAIENVEYTCTISPTLDNGVLSFNITCTGGQINKTGAYTLQANFSSDIKDSVIDEATGDHMAKVTWKFIGLRKIRATATTTGGTTP